MVLIRESSSYERRCKHIATKANANATASTNKRAAVQARHRGRCEDGAGTVETVDTKNALTFKHTQTHFQHQLHVQLGKRRGENSPDPESILFSSRITASRDLQRRCLFGG